MEMGAGDNTMPVPGLGATANSGFGCQFCREPFLAVLAGEDFHLLCKEQS